MPWDTLTGMAKTAAILSTVFLVSLGLCGLNFLAARSSDNIKPPVLSALVGTGVIELLGILGSLLGLMILGGIALVRTIRKRFSPGLVNKEPDGED